MILADLSGGLRMAKERSTEEWRKGALSWLAKANLINTT